MHRLLTLVRTHTLIAGAIVVLVPAVLLLSMQAVWLRRLEQASALAHEMALRSSLEAVGTNIELFYRSTAERLLNVPAALLQPYNMETIGDHWQKKPHRGISHLFVVDYTRIPTGNYLFYDPATSRLTSTTASDQSLAVVLATLPWLSGSLAESAPTDGLQVNERSPEYRMILKPIRSDTGVVGIAGMILDEDFLKNTLIAEAIRETKPLRSRFGGDGDLVVSVRDHRDQPVLEDLGEVQPSQRIVAVPFPFVFKDWTIQILNATPEKWAGKAFIYNMALGAMLSLALLGGVGLALWAASKSMRLSAMKSDFVSNVSHELRTPLASIRVFAELLRHGRATDPGKVREYGEYIDNESRRLSRLIDNILDFSRIESQRKVYRAKPTDIVALIESVVASLSAQMERTGVSLEFDAPETNRPQLLVDADAIAQALHNLIDNAAKYSHAPATIRVELEHTSSGFAVTVCDEGIGIAKADQDHIFKRFHRVGTGPVQDVSGSGLGLAIVAHVMQAHDGRVEVESQLGQGSRFSLWFPPSADAARTDDTNETNAKQSRQ